MSTPQTDTQKIKKAIDLGYRMAEIASSKSLEAYLQNVVIDSRPEPRPFRDVADKWQWSLAKRVIPSLENIARINPGYKGPLNFWFTLGRGCDKTSFIGRLLNWVLAFSKISVGITACAADKDQSRLLIDAMTAEARLNKWLEKRLSYDNYKVTGLTNSSRLQAISADAPSASGLRDDLYVIDEISEWKKRDLWGMIYSARDKRPEGVVIVITNAGVMHTWQHSLFMQAQEDPNWYTFSANGPIASWISKEALENQRKYLTEPEYLRKVMNVWVDPSVEYGLVPYQTIKLCLERGMGRQLTYRTHGDDTIRYVASIDYGPIRDRSVLSVMHMEKDGAIIVDRMDVWQGSKENRVKIEAVERWIDEIRSNFRLDALVIDPYQMESTIQRYTGLVPIERFESRGGKSNHEMTCCLRSIMVNNQLCWYPGCGDTLFKGVNHTLVEEFNELIVKPMGYGQRTEALPGRHDDRVVAIGMAALRLIQGRLKRPLYIADAWF